MSETIRCLNCDAELGPGNGFWVIGKLYIVLSVEPAVCDAQCLYQWDATGIDGQKGHQGFNLAEVELTPIS